jgi:hypothetical protein
MIEISPDDDADLLIATQKLNEGQDSGAKHMQNGPKEEENLSLKLTITTVEFRQASNSLKLFSSVPKSHFPSKYPDPLPWDAWQLGCSQFTVACRAAVVTPAAWASAKYRNI